ncbi:MAG: universal stress protein E [Candidatus Azotimanducaceae bacterium]|jgi:universal stress protein E
MANSKFDLKKVLVQIETENSTQPALDKALTLAKFCDIEIVLLSCDHSQYLVEGYFFESVEIPDLREAYLDNKVDQLEALAAPLREKGLKVSTKALWSYPPYETLAEQAISLEVDLLIHSVARHGAISRLFLTHDDWQLIRCCPVPLLLVKEKAWNNIPKVIAAVDPKHARHKPSGLDHKILNTAIDLSNILLGKVYALHAYGSAFLTETQRIQNRKEHLIAFTELMEGFDVEKNKQVIMEEAPEFALHKLEMELKADLVVMGAVSRSQLSKVFIGNTTERVLDYLNSDVLVLKPDSFSL